uniref:Uncharacterized protein n=1 Tax=Arundo donax TaxID=35708 RepID=A0A0A9FCB1_ARUDO
MFYSLKLDRFQYIYMGDLRILALLLSVSICLATLAALLSSAVAMLLNWLLVCHVVIQFSKESTLYYFFYGLAG